MAEPFVFYFKPDAQQRPQVMYIADLSCACGLCGHPQYQRFYHATGLHTLTLPRYLEVARTVREKVDYACENCGEQVLPEAVERGVVRFAFADDSGEITTYIDYSLTPPGLRHIMRPGRRLDPQIQPDFEVPGDVLVLEELGEESFWRYLGRPLNMKGHWRDVVAQFALLRVQGEEALVVARVAHHILGAATSSQGLTDALQRAYQDLPGAPQTMYEYRLDESADYRLVDQGDVGCWRRWLPAGTVKNVDEGRLFLGALVSPMPVCEVLERGLEVARLRWEKGGVPAIYSNIMTPREELCEDEVRVEDVLHRAVYTGLTVGEAARLTLEEVVGRLLQVW